MQSLYSRMSNSRFCNSSFSHKQTRWGVGLTGIKKTNTVVQSGEDMNSRYQKKKQIYMYIYAIPFNDDNLEFHHRETRLTQRRVIITSFLPELQSIFPVHSKQNEMEALISKLKIISGHQRSPHGAPKWSLVSHLIGNGP